MGFNTGETWASPPAIWKEIQKVVRIPSLSFNSNDFWMTFLILSINHIRWRGMGDFTGDLK